MAEAWRTALDGPLEKARAMAQRGRQGGLRSSCGRRFAPGRAVENATARRATRTSPRTFGRDSLATVAGAAARPPADVEGVAALARRSAELDAFDAPRRARRGPADLGRHPSLPRLDEADAEGRIADANKILDGRDPDELRRRKTTLTEIGGKIEASLAAISGHEEKIREQDEAIARISSRARQARNA